MKLFSVFIGFRRNADSLDLVVFRSFQSIGSGIVADHKAHLCIGDLTVINGIQNCLEIGSSAGNKYADF